MIHTLAAIIGLICVVAKFCLFTQNIEDAWHGRAANSFGRQGAWAEDALWGAWNFAGAAAVGYLIFGC
jgi:hypothetical protein